MNLIQMFNEIETYHKKLGYDYTNATVEQRMDGTRHSGLALYQEVAELMDSFPWKPWRSIEDQTFDHKNAVMEIVDILFFLGGVMEAANINGEEVQIMFNKKMKENYSRIERGYNNKPEERG